MRNSPRSPGEVNVIAARSWLIIREVARPACTESYIYNGNDLESHNYKAKKFRQTTRNTNNVFSWATCRSVKRNTVI